MSIFNADVIYRLEILKKLLILLIFCGNAICINAQFPTFIPLKEGRSSPSFASLYKVDNAKDFGHVSLSYGNFQGDFNRPQLPSSGQLGNFSAVGRQSHKRLIWQGKFAWQYQRDEGQLWNNTSLHPDVQPYLWADESVGRWDRNHFEARANVGSAYAGNWQWGAGLFFEGGEADRYNDPRPLYRYRRLSIAPEVARDLGNDHWIAMQLRFVSYSEDNEMGFFSFEDPLLFRLRGYGTFTRTAFVSGERQLSSQTFEGSIRSMLPKQWIIQGGAGLTRGSAQEGVSMVTDGGEWETLQAHMAISKRWKGSAHSNRIFLLGQLRENEGVDAVFQAINARLQTAQLGAYWEHTKHDTVRMQWQLRIEAGYNYRLQEDLASFINANVQHLPIGMSYGAGWCRNRVKPFVTLDINYRHRLSSDIQIGSTSALTELVVPDFEVLSANALTTQLTVGIEWQQEQSMFRFSTFVQRRTAINAASDFYQNQFGLSLVFIPKGNLNCFSPNDLHPSQFNMRSTL